MRDVVWSGECMREGAEGKCKMTRLLPTVALSIFLNKHSKHYNQPYQPSEKHRALHHHCHQRHQMSAPPNYVMTLLIKPFKIFNARRHCLLTDCTTYTSTSSKYPLSSCFHPTLRLRLPVETAYQSNEPVEVRFASRNVMSAVELNHVR